MKQAILLYNPYAGRGRIERKIESIISIFADADYDMVPVAIRFDDNPFRGHEDVDLAVVAGGDGTLNYVVNAMKRRGMNLTLGILPAGTANDFAGALQDAMHIDKVHLIHCGGKDRAASEREQWNDGANTLCIAPGKIVVYDRNYVTNEILRDYGLDVLEMPSSELSRGRGGPRCMSMPLWREDI